MFHYILLRISDIKPVTIKIFSILCVLLNHKGVTLDLFIIIKTGNTIPGIAQAAKSFPNTNDAAHIQKIRSHNVKTTSCLVRLIPNTIGKVRRPAFLSPIMSSPSFNISLGRLRKNISEEGNIEFLRLRKAEEAIAPTIIVIDSNKATVIFPIRGRLFRKGVYMISRNVDANPSFNKFQSIKPSKILPGINRKIEISNACFFFNLPEGINLSGLFIWSVETSK